MPIHYDSNNEVWVGEHDIYPILVTGPTREGVTARLQDFADRYQSIQSLSESNT